MRESSGRIPRNSPAVDLYHEQRALEQTELENLLQRPHKLAPLSSPRLRPAEYILQHLAIWCGIRLHDPDNMQSARRQQRA
jgi:hypothetical protein